MIFFVYFYGKCQNASPNWTQTRQVGINSPNQSALDAALEEYGLTAFPISPVQNIRLPSALGYFLCLFFVGTNILDLCAQISEETNQWQTTSSCWTIIFCLRRNISREIG